MKKLIINILLLFSVTLFAQPEFSQYNSKVGSFSRLGFGARGMGMGNAMSAVTNGNVFTYYNPALSVFQEGNHFQTSYTFMSLDRSLNFLSFTKKIKLKSSDPNSKRFLGVSAGIINAGVSDIPDTDLQGNIEGDLSTSENILYLSLANKFSEKFVVGITFKYLYFSLYDDISSSGIGIDIGAIYKIKENLILALSISDLNSKYDWDTSDIYGRDGKKTENEFPLLTKIGLAYTLLNNKLTVSTDYEMSDADTKILRFGAEYRIHENLLVRAGCDRLHLENFDIPARPSLGFSYFYSLKNNNIINIDYAFVVEPYSAGDLHVVGVNFNF